MIDPHSEHMGASVTGGVNASSCCGLGSVGRSVPAESPASVTAYSGPRNFAPSQRKI
jgi:hypothetical protein